MITDIMRMAASFTRVAAILVAASVASVNADGTLAFNAADAGVASQGGHDCHRSFPTFMWAGSKAGEHWQVGNQIEYAWSFLSGDYLLAIHSYL